jgi:tetratricopeptide (TPR) repeat protein
MSNIKHSSEHHHEHHPKRIEEIDEPDTDGSEQRRLGRHHNVNKERAINEHLHALLSLITEGEKKRKLDQHPKDGPPVKKIKLSELIGLSTEKSAPESSIPAMNVHQIINQCNASPSLPSTPTKRSSVHTITNDLSPDSPVDKFRSAAITKPQDLDISRITEATRGIIGKSEQTQLYEYAQQMFTAGIQTAQFDKLQASVFLCEAFLSDERVFVLNPTVFAVYQTVAPIKPLESRVLHTAISLVQGEFTEAIISLTFLLGLLADRRSRIFQLRASCFLALGNYFYCLRDLKSTLQFNANNHQVYFMRAQVFLAMGQWEPAYQSSLNFTAKAHSDDANLHVMYYNLAALALKLGKGEELGRSYHSKAKQTEERYIQLNNGHSMTPVPEMKKAAMAYYESDFNYIEYKQFFKATEVKPEVVTGLCGHCGRSDKLSACSTCTTVQYCSKSCQQKHWGKHKVDCSKLKTVRQ